MVIFGDVQQSVGTIITNDHSRIAIGVLFSRSADRCCDRAVSLKADRMTATKTAIYQRRSGRAQPVEWSG